MTHDFEAPDRLGVYSAIDRLISKPATEFTEVGFGQAYDFAHCFRQLHDSGRIVYRGYDITESFVDFALQDYPEYDFRAGGFTDVPAGSCDIIFARHTFMHINRALYPVCLTEFLRATRDLAIISWAMAPQSNGQYKFDREATIHWNTHSKHVTDSIIEREGFMCTVTPISSEKKLRQMYKLQRRTT